MCWVGTNNVCLHRRKDVVQSPWGQTFNSFLTKLGLKIRNIRPTKMAYRITPGAHNPEHATAINSCNGVFTSEFIFRQAFPAKNDCCRLDLFTVGCFGDDFDFPLRELCVFADEVDVPGSSAFCRSSSELLVSV